MIANKPLLLDYIVTRAKNTDDLETNDCGTAKDKTIRQTMLAVTSTLTDVGH